MHPFPPLPLHLNAVATAFQVATVLDRFDWDLLIKALGFVVAAVVAYVQTRGLHLTTRASLKTDLEILKLLDPDSPHHAAVRKAVDKRVHRLYAQKLLPPKPAIIIRAAVAVFGLAWAVAFSYWTFSLLEPGFTWWSLLTGYLAFAGLVWIFIGITGKGLILDLEQSQHASSKAPDT